MPFTLQDILFGGLIPAAIAFALARTMGLAGRWRRAAHLIPSVAVVAGFWAGYWLLNLGPVLPSRDRDWIPYAALAALFPAAISGTPGSARAQGWVLGILGAVVVVLGWLLVPTWPNLAPSRATYLVSWSLATAVLAACQRMLGSRESQRGLWWLAMMTASLAAGAALLALSGSLRFAQSAGAASAAMLGLVAALWRVGDRPPLGGVGVVYSLVLSAALLTGKVNSFSNISTASYFLLPWAPLAGGWLLTRNRRLLAVACWLGVTGAALGWALCAEFGAGG